jgi:cytochrome c nitrite reductase small subunit
LSAGVSGRGVLKVTAVLAGILIGISAFTFRYAEGLSYFSTDPRACANCHIMNDQYASWSSGPHQRAAGCVDCHLPHDFVGKYVAKAVNGYHHSKGFTLQDFHEPILIKPRNAEILQNNCVRCHGDFVHEILIDRERARSGSAHMPNETRCVHCHRGAGHGARG